MEGSHFTVEVSIPANTTAVIGVLAADCGSEMESDKAAAQAEGVKFRSFDGKRAWFDVESGDYRFRAALPK
jgi:alpha-L-rhamnosidase